MTTLGGTSGGWSLWGRRIGRSTERCHVLLCGRVVRCGVVRVGNVSLTHRGMAWWSAFITESLLSYAMVWASCKAHVRVVMPWKIWSIGVNVGWVQ